MAKRFSVTYDVVTEESAEHGGVAESGFASPGGWKHEDRAELGLREAIRAAERSYSAMYGAGFEDAGRWFYTVDGDTNYRTGEDTRYAIHPPEGITPASYQRVARVLCGKRGGRS